VTRALMQREFNINLPRREFQVQSVADLHIIGPVDYGLPMSEAIV
jgi:hypothetical protein